MAILAINNLTKYYKDVRALADVSLKVKAGEFVTVIGRSGAGKSTLLRCVNRMIEPSAGSDRVRRDRHALAAQARPSPREDAHRHDIPALQPRAPADRHRERPPWPPRLQVHPAGLAGHLHRRGEEARHRGPGSPGPRGPDAQTLRPALGRTEAARGHSAGPGAGPPAHPLRRADRLPGPQAPPRRSWITCIAYRGT